MKINDIKVSGSTNILNWAIANKADIKGDTTIQTIINDEMSFILTIGDVNFFELFRLTQMYRDKLRIIEAHQAESPTTEELEFYFRGDCIIDKDKPNETTPAKEVANYAIQSFMNLAYQMQADQDLVKPNALNLFLPMIARKFDIQVPVNFLDIMDCMSVDEAKKIFTVDGFPRELEDMVADKSSEINNILMLNFLRGTSILKNPKRYDDLVKVTKYSSLSSYKKDTIYKFALLDFYKENPVSKEKVKISMFKPDTNEIPNLLKKLGRIEGPLYADFVVEMPIHYMQIIENSISREDLPIAYESSMTSILDAGIQYDDFKLPEFDNPETTIHDTEFNEADGLKVLEYNNKVGEYKVRINESNQILLNSIPILLANESNGAPSNLDVDPTATFSMLPSIYKTRAVFNVNFDTIRGFMSSYEPLVSNLFNDLYLQILEIVGDIKKASKT